MNPILLLIAAALPGAGLAIHAQPAPLSVAQDITELIAQLEGDDPTQKLAAAERIKGLGKRGAKAVPALMRLLPSGDGPLVGASVEALVAVGPKARAALLEALESGSFEGEPMPPGPVSAALLQLGKRARVAVEAYIQAAERGPALFLTLEELGPAGLMRGFSSCVVREAIYTAGYLGLAPIAKDALVESGPAYFKDKLGQLVQLDLQVRRVLLEQVLQDQLAQLGQPVLQDLRVLLEQVLQDQPGQLGQPDQQVFLETVI